MSTILAPFGLRPALHISGVLRTWAGTIISGLASNIFQYSPVQVSNDAGNGTGGLILAAAGARAIGTFMGVEYTLTADGRRHVSNWWTSGTVATDIVAYYTRDPWITYEIQANGVVNQADLGNQADWTTNDTNAGSTVTGMSSVGLNQATLTSTGNAGLRIVGFSQYVDNAIGDAFTIVEVEISEHQNIADRIAYGG
jgi:hypothetical protein